MSNVDLKVELEAGTTSDLRGVPALFSASMLLTATYAAHVVS